MIPGRPALRAGGQYRGRAAGPVGEWKEALLPATSHRASQALPGNLGLQSDPALAHRHCHRPQGQAAWGEARGGRQPVAASGSSENRTDHIGQRAATRLTPRQRPHRAPEKDEPRTAGTQTPCLLGRSVHARVCVCTCVFTRKEKKGQEKPQDSTSPPTAAGHLEAPWATADGLALLPGVPGKVPGGRGSLGRKRPRATLHYCPPSLPAG